MCCYGLQLAAQVNRAYRKHNCCYIVVLCLLCVSLDLPRKLFGVEED